MTAFNSWYYSFSPQVADYERQQPWLQGSLRVAIYPLLGILQTAEKAYTTVPGEYGSIAAGLVASSLIGAVYFSPIAISIRQVRKNRLDYRIAIAIITASLISVAAALVTNNVLALMVTTALLVLSTLSFAAIYSAKAIWKIFQFCRNQKALPP
jgi:peptide/nickel transport system substrate-binding protein